MRKASPEVLLDLSATYPEAVELGWKSSVAEFEKAGYTKPWASMASATRMKPVMFAPAR